MFLAAVLKGSAFSVPVRIRNMSVTGALVEGAAMPDSGSSVRLIRGSLMIPADVVWASAERCGLRFAGAVSIKEWLAPPSNPQQKRVDSLVGALKAGAIPLPIRPEPHDASSPFELGLDLRGVSKLLEAHCEDLMADPQAIVRYGDKLQNLDIVLQTIATVADMLGGQDDQEVLASRLQNLRLSTRQALARAG